MIDLLGDLHRLLGGLDAEAEPPPPVTAASIVQRVDALHASTGHITLLALSLRLTECYPTEPTRDPRVFRDTFTYLSELVAVHRRCATDW